MANAGARGLTGSPAINAIVSRFERPADPSSEIAKASGFYGDQPTEGFSPQGVQGMDASRRHLLASLLDMKPSDLPQLAPQRTHFRPGLPGSENGAVQHALSQLGTPYKWGGTAWGKALDCSALVQGSFGLVGVKIGRTTYTQWRQGHPVDPRQLQPGDVVFFDMGTDGPNHEGLYIGSGQFVEAAHTGTRVRISDLNRRPGFVGARRFT